MGIKVINSNKCFGSFLKLTKEEYFQYLLIVMSKPARNTGHYSDITYKLYCECMSMLNAGMYKKDIVIQTGIAAILLNKIEKGFLQDVVEKYESVVYGRNTNMTKCVNSYEIGATC